MLLSHHRTGGVFAFLRGWRNQRTVSQTRLTPSGWNRRSRLEVHLSSSCSPCPPAPWSPTAWPDVSPHPNTCWLALLTPLRGISLLLSGARARGLRPPDSGSYERRHCRRFKHILQVSGLLQGDSIRRRPSSSRGTRTDLCCRVRPRGWDEAHGREDRGL